uniref:RING-CH-type domain-containing protein n=1 Tax=Branchiostoma floridae TaxID=7739 RepID=C3YVA2_BRAFL|eukprot:XP_002599806.1 hypothetical protein BRAFLDRAFT_119339 [Branchiostoma floridae]
METAAWTSNGLDSVIHKPSVCTSVPLAQEPGIEPSSTTIDEEICRICHSKEDLTNFKPLVSPCACSGSIQFTHLDCLSQWLRNKDAPSDRCEVCKTKFDDDVIQRCQSLAETSESSSENGIDQTQDASLGGVGIPILLFCSFFSLSLLGYTLFILICYFPKNIDWLSMLSVVLCIVLSTSMLVVAFFCLKSTAAEIRRRLTAKTRESEVGQELTEVVQL